jgi:hypothetical protein
MTAELHIERLIISGLTPGQPALVLRDEVERALSGLLTRAAVEQVQRQSPARLPPIRIGAPPPGRTVAMHIALAIRDALVVSEDHT